MLLFIYLICCMKMSLINDTTFYIYFILNFPQLSPELHYSVLTLYRLFATTFKKKLSHSEALLWKSSVLGSRAKHTATFLVIIFFSVVSSLLGLLISHSSFCSLLHGCSSSHLTHPWAFSCFTPLSSFSDTSSPLAPSLLNSACNCTYTQCLLRPFLLLMCNS